MILDDVLDRLLNLGVIATVALSGLAYSRLLWVFNLRPTATLVVAGIAPGAIFLATVWAIRALQGTPSTVYIVLIVNWLIFSTVGVAAVLIARRRHR